MDRHHVERLLGTLLAILMGLAHAPGASAAPWQVFVEQADLSSAAAAVRRGNAVVVNATALAPALGIAVRAAGGAATIIDRAGAEWRGENGATRLERAAGVVPLAFPLQILGNAVYLPADALAEMAGMHAQVDEAAGVVRLLSSQPTGGGAIPKASGQRDQPAAAAADPAAGTANAPEGWEALSIPKAPRTGAAALAGDSSEASGGRARGSDHNPPPSGGSIRWGIGAGYVQGADAGMEVAGAGTLFGIGLQANTLLTQGRHGLVSRGGRISLLDRDAGWSAEGGDLTSEVWGMRRGVRLARRVGVDHWPSLALYLPGTRDEESGTIVALRDEARLSRWLVVGGEAASDGSYSVRAGVHAGPAALFAYHRGGRTPGWGVYADYSLPHGLGIYGSLGRSGPRLAENETRTVGVRLPVWRQLHLNLERTESRYPGQQLATHSAGFGLPIGPLRLMTRYQLADGWWQFPSGDGTGRVSQHRRDWMTALGCSAGSRLALDYQVNMSWAPDARTNLWEQLVASFRLSPHTSLQAVTGIPDLTDPQRLRLRLDHQVGNDLSLLLDYGRIAPYQEMQVGERERGFKIMVRKTWDMRTPGGGGQIAGRVLDQTHKPVPNVTVRWNGYSVVTDRQGRYLLPNVPPGTHHVVLDKTSLPADYRSDDGDEEVRVRLHHTEKLDFRVIPLSTMSGAVFWDRNANGRRDAGEGIQGAVVRLNGFVTATEPDGSFAFYNVTPGIHTVRLDTERLPEEFVPVGGTEARADLLPDRPLTGITFQVLKREKPVIFQTLP